MKLEDLHGWIEYDVAGGGIARAWVMGPIRYPRIGEGTYPHPCRDAWNVEAQRFVRVTQKHLDEGSKWPLAAPSSHVAGP